MELLSRLDFISRSLHLVFSKDTITFEVVMNEDAMDHVVLALARKKTVKAMLKEERDLQKFASPVLAPPAGRNWVADELMVVAEAKEVAGDLITDVVLDQLVYIEQRRGRKKIQHSSDERLLLQLHNASHRLRHRSYIASWLVKLLLLKGYRVHGTVRNLDDPKNSHLRSFRGADERLTLYKADLLDQDGSLHDAFLGCHGLFHVASPISNDPVRVRDAVEGTKNVMRAATESGIRRVVFTSSIGAVHMNPNRSPDKILDESCWSDPEFCKNTKNWYYYGKMMAERVAMMEAERTGIKLMVVVPPVVMGPILQPSNSSTVMRLVDYMIGLKKSYPNIVQGYVDVRDVARAHLLVYETPEASGRYLCIESVLHHSQILGILREMFPNYPITSRSGEETANEEAKPFKFSIQRLRDLGFYQFIPIKQSLYETVKLLQERGYIPPPLPSSL